jgi:hypothetical protein
LLIAQGSKMSIWQRNAAAIRQYRKALLVAASGRSKNWRWVQRRVIR